MENPAASVAGGIEEVQISSPLGSRTEGDHILDFNVANFSTPAGKQILHDVGKYGEYALELVFAFLPCAVSFCPERIEEIFV